ncbi:MAG: hypothetical protein ACOYI4_04795 [Christensenellales bacterium]|jgi:ethanolamine utilization cobalamin adenosyltransferase
MKGDECRTSLSGNQVAAKDSREIRFRGKLDSLSATIAYAAAVALERGQEALAKDLHTLFAGCMSLLSAGVSGADVGEIAYLGMEYGEVQELSHRPDRMGLKHFLPVAADGVMVCLVNLVRTKARETECDAVALYGDIGGHVKALNRMSSAAYVVMCRLKAGFY